MSEMPTMKKGRWGSHKDAYRGVVRRENSSLIAFSGYDDDSYWKFGNAFLPNSNYAPTDLQVACDEFKEAAGISELAEAVSPKPKDGLDFVVLFDKGSSGSSGRALFVVEGNCSGKEDAWNVVSGTSMASPAVAGLLIQHLASSGVWIDAEGATKQSDYFTKLRKILANSASGYEKGWLSRKLPIVDQEGLSDEENTKTTSLSWIRSPEQILRRLADPDTSVMDRMTAVLFAETTAFRPDQKPRMLDALFAFANANRFSNDEKTVVAVGSAVRKFAMNMPASMLDQYSALFVPSATESISCRIELELAKGASWRLARLPVAECASAKQLESRLTELALDYLAPRLILQKNYASIALAATAGVILMNGESQEELLNRVRALRAGQHEMNWFRELLADRLVDIARKQVAIDGVRADRLRVMARELDGSVHC